MQYAETYKFGNTIVHIKEPEPKTPEEIDKILDELHQVGWEIFYEALSKEKETA